MKSSKHDESPYSRFFRARLRTTVGCHRHRCYSGDDNRTAAAARRVFRNNFRFHHFAETIAARFRDIRSTLASQADPDVCGQCHGTARSIALGSDRRRRLPVKDAIASNLHSQRANGHKLAARHYDDKNRHRCLIKTATPSKNSC